MLYDKTFSTLLAQLGTPSTWCRGQLLCTPFVAGGYSNSEIVETVLKWGKQSNGLVVVLFDKSLPRLLDRKGLLQILQVAIVVQDSINSICCKWLLPLNKKWGKNSTLAIRCVGLKKLLRMSQLRQIQAFWWLIVRKVGLFRIRH